AFTMPGVHLKEAIAAASDADPAVCQLAGIISSVRSRICSRRRPHLLTNPPHLADSTRPLPSAHHPLTIRSPSLTIRSTNPLTYPLTVRPTVTPHHPLTVRPNHPLTVRPPSPHHLAHRPDPTIRFTIQPHHPLTVRPTIWLSRPPPSAHQSPQPSDHRPPPNPNHNPASSGPVYTVRPTVPPTIRSPVRPTICSPVAPTICLTRPPTICQPSPHHLLTIRPINLDHRPPHHLLTRPHHPLNVRPTIFSTHPPHHLLTVAPPTICCTIHGQPSDHRPPNHLAAPSAPPSDHRPAPPICSAIAPTIRSPSAHHSDHPLYTVRPQLEVYAGSLIIQNTMGLGPGAVHHGCCWHDDCNLTLLSKASSLCLGAGVLAVMSIDSIGGPRQPAEPLPSPRTSPAPTADYDNSTLGAARPAGLPQCCATSPTPDYPWLGAFFGRQHPVRLGTGRQRGRGFLKTLPLLLMISSPGMVSRFTNADIVACVNASACERLCGIPEGLQQLRGVMIAAMLAALISSITSIFNSGGTLFTIDLWLRLAPAAGEVEKVIVGSCSSWPLTVIGVLWLPIVRTSGGGQLVREGGQRPAPIASVHFLHFGISAVRLRSADHDRAISLLTKPPWTGSSRRAFRFFLRWFCGFSDDDNGGAATEEERKAAADTAEAAAGAASCTLTAMGSRLAKQQKEEINKLVTKLSLSDEDRDYTVDTFRKFCRFNRKTMSRDDFKDFLAMMNMTSYNELAHQRGVPVLRHPMPTSYSTFIDRDSSGCIELAEIRRYYHDLATSRAYLVGARDSRQLTDRDIDKLFSR
uniref:EF-hand domain-containing protein n=1 Tax=Macrostomum lignano TaxID=282301 RepID=A0A1I8FIA8_9PLAT